MVLRNFLYLDTDMLNDYLSTLEGYLVESAELIENQVTKTSGKAGVTFVEAGRESDKESGTVKRVAHTNAGKFQRLYELLEDESMVQYLEAFDSTIWNGIKRNEILEVPGIISIPQMYSTLHEVGNISPLVDLMKAFGQSDLIDEKSMNAINGLKAIGDLNDNKDIPVVLNLESMSEYSFAAKLIPDYLKCEIDKLDGEVTIIGKVQKKIPKNEKYEVFSMVSGVDSLMKHQNREERRKYEKNKTDKNMSDTIKGPAMVLIPLAIFR